MKRQASLIMRKTISWLILAIGIIFSFYLSPNKLTLEFVNGLINGLIYSVAIIFYKRKCIDNIM